MVLVSLSYDGGSQLGEVMPPETVAMSGITFGCYSWVEFGVPLGRGQGCCWMPCSGQGGPPQARTI